MKGEMCNCYLTGHQVLYYTQHITQNDLQPYFMNYITPPARGDTFLLVVGDVILWVSNLVTSAKSWGQTFNNS